MRIFCPKCHNIFQVEPSEETTSCNCPKCSAEIEMESGKVFPGVVLGDFLIESLISSGGMGTVYVAKQLSLDREVALKVLLEKFGTDPEYIQNLLHEARAAAKLNHPNIVQAYAVGEEDGVFYFAMEYIRGETYKKILARKKKLAPLEAARVIRDVANALDAAYREQKIVHRDIKPENIMRDVNGYIKLADLGLAQKSGSGSAADSDEVSGTPQYISPEQLTGLPADPRSDIYSLGATFYHFVTGRFPYTGKDTDEITDHHLKGDLTPPREIEPDLPEEINDIIMKMMARDIEKRYQSPSEVVKALDEYIQLEVSQNTLKRRLRKISGENSQKVRPKLTVKRLIRYIICLVAAIILFIAAAIILENRNLMPQSIAPVAGLITTPLRNAYKFICEKSAAFLKFFDPGKPENTSDTTAKPKVVEPPKPQKVSRRDFINEAEALTKGKVTDPQFAKYCKFLRDYPEPTTDEERKILSALLTRFAAIDEARSFAPHRAAARAVLEKNVADAKAKTLAIEQAQAQEKERLKREAEAKAAAEKIRKEQSDKLAREYRATLIADGRTLISEFSKNIRDPKAKNFDALVQKAAPELPDDNPIAQRAATQYNLLRTKLSALHDEVAEFAAELSMLEKHNILTSIRGYGMAKVLKISPDGTMTLNDLKDNKITVNYDKNRDVFLRVLNSLGRNMKLADDKRNQAIFFFALYLDRLDADTVAAAKDDFWKNYLTYISLKE